MSIKPLIAGNWKMNGLGADLPEFQKMEGEITEALMDKVDFLICPPFTLLSRMVGESAKIAVGSQDCHAKESGAHTGDVSASMLKEAGATFVIVGHSERRQDHGETDDVVRAKAEAAQAAGLTAIVCVGETREEREAGKAREVVLLQIKGSLSPDMETDRLVIAYEPVWAIGTGLVPTNDDIAEIHNEIRASLESYFQQGGDTIRLLYGGSMKPGNAGEILAVSNVNGGLIGGASLKADDFIAIAQAAG